MKQTIKNQIKELKNEIQALDDFLKLLDQSQEERLNKENTKSNE